MKREAAKKQALFRSALAILALLLLASPAFATRTNPVLANDLGEQRGTTLLIGETTADDLAATLNIETQNRFPLFANENQFDSVYKRTVVCAPEATFRLLSDFSNSPRIITSQKLVSGDLVWEPRFNLRKVRELVAVSRLCHETMEDIDSPNLYAAMANQPNMARDPMGEVIETPWDAISFGMGAYSFYNNIEEGNLGWATLDAVGMVADAVAILIPGLPGGAGAAIKASRAGKAAFRALRIADQAAGIAQGVSQAGDEFEKGNYGTGAFYAGLASFSSVNFARKIAPDIAKDLANRSLQAQRGFVKLDLLLPGVPKSTALSETLTMQKELSELVNRQGAVVDRWLGSANSRWAKLYRSVQGTNPNFAKGIRGRILDIRMRGIFRKRFGDIPDIRIDQTIRGSGNKFRPDLYFPALGGRRVIFDVGSPSKVTGILDYEGMADDLVPLIPRQWF